MKVNPDKCTCCGHCVRDCPVDAVKMVKKKAVINDHLCTDCGVCLRVCEFEAITVTKVMPAEAIESEKRFLNPAQRVMPG